MRKQCLHFLHLTDRLGGKEAWHGVQPTIQNTRFFLHFPNDTLLCLPLRFEGNGKIPLGK